MLSVITTVLDPSRDTFCAYAIILSCWGGRGLARTIPCQMGFIGARAVNGTNMVNPLMRFSNKKGLRLKLHCMHARNYLNCKL